MVREAVQEFFPRQLYEALPYSYLLVGSIATILIDNPMGRFWGLVLYSLGALVWILRSRHRRQDQHRRQQQSLYLPEFIYESLPFAYIAAAILLLSQIISIEAITIAVIFALLGIQRLMIRVRHRRHAWIMHA